MIAISKNWHGRKILSPTLTTTKPPRKSVLLALGRAGNDHKRDHQPCLLHRRYLPRYAQRSRKERRAMPKSMNGSDNRFYFKIWNGPSAAFNERNPSVYYCENHNGELDYGLAATDFEMAANALISIQLEQPNTGNWVAPILHMVRQTLELNLKSLLQMINWRTGNTTYRISYDHNLELMWGKGRTWLIEQAYRIEQDARLNNTDRIIENLHAIDPIGDLFRFGTSRKEAFGRAKSSDRVGYNQKDLCAEYEDALGFLGHWRGVIMREIIMAEQGWECDPYFNRDAFPKVDHNT